MTHLSGVGCPDLGVPVVVPFTGAPPGSFEAAGSAYRDEAAHAGYYTVYLEGPAALAELTATPRTAVLRFRFDLRWRPIVPASERARVRGRDRVRFVGSNSMSTGGTTTYRGHRPSSTTSCSGP